jgi:hypothetical protein
MSHVDVFVTDFGVVRAGPIFKAELQLLSGDLKKSKRTNAYKRAKTEIDRLESAVSVLAAAYWRADKDFTVTP